VFAAVRHCARRDVVEVLTDPFGLQALYVASRGDLTYVCTSALALARHLAAEPDPVGAALFLRTGVQYGPVTHWQGVERVEPGTVMTFGPAGRRVATYWRPSASRPTSAGATAAGCTAGSSSG
jgi:asparagine synthetase B (glutamine-hydrolysing)